MKWCLVRSPSDKPQVSVFFQSPAVPGYHPVCTTGGENAGEASTPLLGQPWPRQDLRLHQLQIWCDSPTVTHLWAGAMGLWVPLSKGSPASPAAGTGGTVPRWPLCRCWHTGVNSGSISHHWTSPYQLLDCPFPINCRCCQRVSWLFSWQCCCKKAFLVAAFHHQNGYSAVNQSWLKCRWRWLPKLGCLCQTPKAVELSAHVLSCLTSSPHHLHIPE